MGNPGGVPHSCLALGPAPHAPDICRVGQCVEDFSASLTPLFCFSFSVTLKKKFFFFNILEVERWKKGYRKNKNKTQMGIDNVNLDKVIFFP